MTTADTPDSAAFSSAPEAVPMSELPLGSRCRVVAIDENSESLLRLMEMGLAPGTEVTLERAAPLLSPLSVRLPGCTLAIRLEDARRVLVQPLPPPPSADESAPSRP
jgi:Fe2+ transport system protein FeoA